MARAAEPGEAGDPRARRQERQHRVRRRRRREGRRHRAVRRLRQRRPGLLRPQPDPRASAACYDRFLELLEPAVAGVRVAAPGLDDTEMGPLVSAGQRDSVSAYVDDTVDVAFRGTAPDGPGYWYPPTVVLPRVAAGPGLARGGLRPGRRGDAVRRRGRRDPAGQRHRVRPVRLDLDPRRRPGPAGRARGVESGNLSVNSHSSVRYSTPFGGFKQSGLGRELGPDALDSFTDVKNVFISTED